MESWVFDIAIDVVKLIRSDEYILGSFAANAAIIHRHLSVEEICTCCYPSVNDACNI